MSIRIQSDRCIGCGKCAEVCPGSLIAVEHRTAVMKYPKDCWGCVSCVKECKAGAISFYLGSDIGGNETYLQVKQEGTLLHWQFYRKDELIKTITVDRNNSNQY